MIKAAPGPRALLPEKAEQTQRVIAPLARRIGWHVLGNEFDELSQATLRTSSTVRPHNAAVPAVRNTRETTSMATKAAARPHRWQVQPQHVPKAAGVHAVSHTLDATDVLAIFTSSGSALARPAFAPLWH